MLNTWIIEHKSDYTSNSSKMKHFPRCSDYKYMKMYNNLHKFTQVHTDRLHKMWTVNSEYWSQSQWNDCTWNNATLFFLHYRKQFAKRSPKIVISNRKKILHAERARLNCINRKAQYMKSNEWIKWNGAIQIGGME